MNPAGLFDWFLVGSALTLGHKFTLTVLGFAERLVDKYVFKSTL